MLKYLLVFIFFALNNTIEEMPPFSKFFCTLGLWSIDMLDFILLCNEYYLIYGVLAFFHFVDRARINFAWSIEECKER